MRQLTQFNLELLVEGTPSDQLRETVEQVNSQLLNGTLEETTARGLIQQALCLELFSRYFDFPLEGGSPQTLELEAKKVALRSQK